MSISFQANAQTSESASGEYLGAIPSETPHWFKESFLEFEEDVAEASAQGRRVMIYFHQEGCPYCARLVQENFNDPATEAYIRKHFDGITVNMWGDREVISVAGNRFTEKSFAAALKVQYTPTLIFLDEAGKVALRLNGYYPPAEFRNALEYVAERQETRLKFSEYQLQLKPSSSANLIAEDFFLQTERLDQLATRPGKPLAVFFESGGCDECKVMHERILGDAATRKLVTQMDNVQFDIRSVQTITRPDGAVSTVAQWAQDLDIAYTPSVVFFDSSGKEVMRIDAFLKTFHFQSVFDYVLEKAYLSEPSFQRYISARGERLRAAGIDTDIWGYESDQK